MADTSTQRQTQTSSENTRRQESQTSNQNVRQTQQTGQTQSQQAAKNSWLLNMPGMQQLVSRVTQEMGHVTVTPYQLAGLNPTQQAALQVLSQGRSDAQMQTLLKNYQSQAAGFTNYGAQQQEINQLAKGYYQGDIVTQQKQQLQNDINRQLSGQVNQLNQQAIGSGNMASSRAGISQGVMQRGAEENYAKGAASIENSARQEAYNMAYQQYNQGQSNLFSSLNAQTNLANTLAGWKQADAQTAFNAGLQTQKAQQQQYDVTRQNQMMQKTPGLQALQQYLPALSSLASFGVNTVGSATGTTNSNGGTTGTTTTTGTQTTGVTGTTGLTGTSTGPATNWGALGAGVAGEAAGSMLQPVASAVGGAAVNWLSSLF